MIHNPQRFYRFVTRAFTLLELIIAMSLTLIIMSTLMYFYSDLTKISMQTQQLNDKHFYWQYAGSRLAEILPKIVGPSAKNTGKETEDFRFYSIDESNLTKAGSQSLVFAYDNGVSLDKLFSNVVIGRLYVDKNNQLTLAYWPAPSRWTEKTLPPMKKEILKQNVASISFEFFIAPDKSVEKKPGSSTSDLEPMPKGAWRTQAWQREFHSLPAMVKMSIKPLDNSLPVVYAFPLINNPAMILYD
jgi:hypothetical protein